MGLTYLSKPTPFCSSHERPWELPLLTEYLYPLLQLSETGHFKEQGGLGAKVPSESDLDLHG